MASQTWQELLDYLTPALSRQKYLHNLKNKNEIDLSKMFLNHSYLRSQVLEWMRQCLRKTRQKSSLLSKDLRIMGNSKFKMCEDNASLSLYTDSLCVAPNNSEEFALALANRSAVLYRMHRFEDCIKDAELALSSAYPKILRHKLLLRLGRCMFHLNRWRECKDVLDIAKGELNSGASQLSDDQIREAMQDVESLSSDLDQYRYAETVLKKNGTPPKLRKSSLEPPQPLAGPNPDFPSASSALILKYKQGKGRYVIGTQPIKQGDILFVEKPYAFVVLPEQYKSHCHHCCVAVATSIPCENCAEALFCSKACSIAATTSYHKWECGGLQLMSAVGIAHLSLRVVLVTGSPTEVAQKASAATKVALNHLNRLGDGKDHYSAVYSLLPHLEDMYPDDIFQYCLTAMLLTLYLLHYTSYFSDCGSINLQEPVKSSIVVQVCALILRHVLQLVCNAHAITKLDSDATHGCAFNNEVVSETQQRVATAIYPSASMMNHSCDPNIINSFLNELLIVKASCDIPVGSEIFNCYGPHFQRMGTAERQAALQAQYYFACDCTACTTNRGESLDPLQERLSALCCPACRGPLMELAPGREPAGSKAVQNELTNVHRMVCESCGMQQPISSLVCDAFSAHDLFRQGCEALDGGNLQEALRFFHLCYELQERCLYRSNRDLTATVDQIAKCYAMLGEYTKSIEYLQRVIPAIEEQFGSSSVEVANELQKLSDVMLCELHHMPSTPPKEKISHAQKVVQRAHQILSVHYGDWNSGCQELCKKIEEIKVLDAMAAMQNASVTE